LIPAPDGSSIQLPSTLKPQDWMSVKNEVIQARRPHHLGAFVGAAKKAVRISWQRADPQTGSARSAHNKSSYPILFVSCPSIGWRGAV